MGYGSGSYHGDRPCQRRSKDVVSCPCLLSVEERHLSLILNMAGKASGLAGLCGNHHLAIHQLNYQFHRGK